jgi:molecular chaperone GrpE
LNWKKALAARFRQLRGNGPSALAAGPATGAGKSGPGSENSQAALLHYLDERLAAQERRLAALLEPASSPLIQEDAGALMDVLVQGLAGLEKQFNRVGREQFKINTLFEAQQAQTGETLELLRTAQARQEAESAVLRDRSRASLETLRLQMASALLPVLDGLEEALAAGRRLVEIQTPPAPAKPPRAGLFRRPVAAVPAPTRSETALREAVLEWLAGLELVRERMLEWLAAQEVLPLTTLGRPYDPQQQVAVEVVPAGPECPPGTVVAEIRRGYRSGDQVLRYAEVTVAR